jgi:hypothetical protein
MVIERDKEDIVIRLNAPINMSAAQKVIDYFNLLESISKNQGTEEQAEELAWEAHRNWMKENAYRFTK